MEKSKSLSLVKKDCLKTVLGLYKRANAGHIGSSLSSLDLLVHLFFKQMKKEDKFILSKGHAAASLYTVLAKSGRIDESLLDTYYADGTLLAAHPPCGANKVPGIIFGTGSLGHGLSIATGLAFSSRYTKKKFHVYCVISEGDCNEGSTWEAILFAAHHKLKNLTVIIDRNGLQGFGFSKDVLNLDSLEEKMKAFNLDTYVIENGNDLSEIDKVFKQTEKSMSEMPRCIIAKTTKGSGVSYMENKLEWHYLPMNDADYELALKGLE